MTLVSDEHPVARKPHQCCVCLGTISKGDTYYRQFVVDGREHAWTWKAHGLCERATWEAYREIGLAYDDCGPDWYEDVRPYVEAFFSTFSALVTA